MPKTLFKDGGYDHREALFGRPPYGGSIAQTIYYTDSDLCDSSLVDPTTGFPSRAVDPKTGKQEAWLPPFILMADRGTCSFVQKARNAQHAGAAGLIIADNVCQCNDEQCLKMEQDENDGSSFLTNCQGTEPIMADDGSGGDITIPTFLMFKYDAAQIKKEVKDKEATVQIEMSWALPHPDSKVEYELWTVPSEEVSKDFQRDWKDVAVKLGEKVFFHPRQYIYDGVKTRCRYEGQDMCFTLCTNEGRYCATDPDNDLENGISGADVVRESLRRICVWKYHGKDGLGIKYWDYVSEFLKRCDSDDFFANEDCVKDAMKHAKIDKKQIDQCMDDTGGLEKDTNKALDDEIEEASRKGVVVLPTMFVNTAPMRGALNSQTVLNAVCAGFTEEAQPSVCATCRECDDVVTCVKKGVCKKSGKSYSTGGGGVSKKTFGTTLLLMCALFGAAGYIHWRKTREEMRDQVRGILAEYMPLEGGEDPHQSPMDFARAGQSASLIS